MDENVNKTLELIGLGKNERKVYLDLIRNGKSSVLEIAKRTAVHRTNVYDSLRNLIRNGFILEKIEENKRLFISRPPEKIKDYLAQIMQQAASIIPILESSSRNEPESESISMSKGNLAIRDALTGLLERNSNINVFGATKQARDRFGSAFLDEFHKKRIQKKILMRHIYHQEAIERINYLNRLKYTVARYLPKKYDSKVATVICGDIVLLIIFTDPVSLIRIQNRDIADAYGKYFEILWAKSKK